MADGFSGEHSDPGSRTGYHYPPDMVRYNERQAKSPVRLTVYSSEDDALLNGVTRVAFSDDLGGFVIHPCEWCGNRNREEEANPNVPELCLNCAPEA